MRAFTRRFVFLSLLLLYLFSIQARTAQPTVNSPGSLIFRSDNRGEQWIAVGSLPNVVELVTDPVTSGTIYATTRIGIYKSGDGGTSWSKIGNGLPAGPILKLVFDPQNSSTLYTTAPVSDSSTGVFKSTDGGINWNRTATTNIRAFFTIAPSDPATIYAEGNGLFKSTDGGASWNPINQPTYFAHGSTRYFRLSGFAVAPGNRERLYATTLAASDAPLPGSVHRSVDGGASWRGSLMQNSTLLALDPNDSQLVYVKSIGSALGNGIFKTLDGGDNWTQIGGETLGLFSISSLVVSPKNSSLLYAPFGNNFSTSTPKGGIYKSENGGQSWRLLSTGNGLPNASITSVAVDANNSSKLYAATVPGITPVSAAAYDSFVARESIASLFGTNLTMGSGQASSIPLPVSLADASVKVRDGKGIERDAPLFYASPTQINFQVPEGTASGIGTLSVVRSGEIIAADGIVVLNVAPGIFSADMNGKGIPVGVVLRISADGIQTYEAISRFDPVLGRNVAIPINLGSESEQVFLSLFGTGYRFRSSESAVKMTIGGIDVPIVYAGLQPTLVGVDQINAQLTRSLAGKGEVNLEVTVDDVRANTLRITIQ